VDNQSREQATSAYLAGLADNPRVRLLDYPRPFNYSTINNLAAAHASHPYLLFLNNDTQVISADWLRAMVEHIQRPEVGAVGAKLLYPGNTIQHGGLALGGGGRLCGDYFRGSPENQAAHVLTQVIRNCSAVTGACLLTKKNLFQAVGGFDAVNLPICYNDVDLCLKLRDRGYLIVWTPYARLYHHESVSRAHTPPLAELTRLCREQKFFEAKWLAVLEQDPYYNPNLSRLFDGYAY
jgi:GT2 family glycosyltransferase